MFSDRTCLNLLASIPRGRFLLRLALRPRRRTRAQINVHRDVPTHSIRRGRLCNRAQARLLLRNELHRRVLRLLRFLHQAAPSATPSAENVSRAAHLLPAEARLALGELDLVHRVLELVDAAVQLLEREPRVPHRLWPVEVLHADVLEHPARVFVQGLLAAWKLSRTGAPAEGERGEGAYISTSV